MTYATDAELGLSAEEVKQRVKRGCSNGSFDVKTKSVGQIIRDNIFTLFNLINAVLALLVALTGSYRNMLFMGVVIANAAIGLFQELRSKRVIDKLSLISAPKAVVVRGGREESCAVADIVIDDIMLLSSGSQICADCVVISGECEADESLITGESDPVYKKPGSELISGSFVVSGSVRAQVIRVGAQSYANKITVGAKRIKKQSSEMMRSINRIIRTVSVCIVPFSLVLFFKAIFITNQEFDAGIISTVAAIIGMIPEGLVLLTSVALAVSSVRLAMRQTLCQDLYCVEHLAGVDVLCLDKTGTITEGSMEVTELLPIDESFGCEAALDALSAVMTDVNPTFAAIRNRYHGKSEMKASCVIPFSSARKWSAAAFDGFGTLILGAPSFVLSDTVYREVKPLAERYLAEGMRVLLLAYSKGTVENNVLPSEVQPKALVVLTDKIRASAPDTLEYFRKQGVSIKVISGDDPITVSGVAKRAGLSDAEHFVDASALGDDELCAAAEKYTVFGRVTPQRKLELVRALKQGGHKVAMTGDGVNDVLALKEADCSVAMQSGSGAARSVSQLVLLDSDFASMPAVVEEGRRVINNIRRSAALFLVKTIFSFLLAVVFLAVPHSYPFRPIQMTLISALTIGIPSFLLALEPNHSIVRGSFISNVLSRAFPGGASVTVGIILLLIAQSLFSIPQDEASVIAVFLTAAVCFCVVISVCVPFNTMRAVMVVLLVVGFIGAVTFVPSLFYIVPLSAVSWAVLAVIAAAELLCLLLISKGSKALFKEKKAPLLSQRLKRIIISCVFAFSLIFALWFGAVLADYCAVANQNEPIAARLAEDGSYDGLFYTINDGVISIMGREVSPAAFYTD
ncbi:MAG: HAD-IC family P-type ATPase [Oscillospiraceae bacterium]